jgi:hypothetical protein
MGLAAEERGAEQAALLDALAEELGRLRKAVLRQGHAQELFQARVEEAVARLAGSPGAGAASRPPEAVPDSAQGPPEAAPAAASRPPEAGPAAPPRPPAAGLSSAQTRALLELDQALLQLIRLAGGGEATTAATPEDAPGSLREGLAFLQVRVRNLQHSMGLEAIPALGLPFDDRWHEACGVAHRADLPDGWVAEEILPGYRLGERVVRPARVVVNRRASEEPHG